MSYLIIGVEGHVLTNKDQKRLQRQEVGGVILFTRNYDHPQQLQALIAHIRDIDPKALICIDQEGGRVQRLKQPFSLLPPLGQLGELYEQSPGKALSLASQHAWLMASEMLSLGIDLSFAPVLDLDCVSDVIGDRSFSAKVEVVMALTTAYLQGLKEAGIRTRER